MPERINLLARHHQRLVEIIRSAEPLITALSDDADIRGLRHLRREMGEAIAAYVRFIQEDVAELSIYQLSIDAETDALALVAKCLQLQNDYKDFVNKWSEFQKIENWTKYRLSARCMMQHVRNHILEVATAPKRWIIHQAA